MVFIDKNSDIYLMNCSGEKLSKINNINSLISYFDHNVILEEGFKVKNYLEFIKKYQLENINDKMKYIFDSNNEKYFDDNELEYISIMNKYDVYIEGRICRINRKIPEMLVVDKYGDLEYLFYYDLFNEHILDLEMRIEEEIVEYIDMTFIMDKKISLIEFIQCFCDSLIE